jgi:hypothetical protein
MKAEGASVTRAAIEKNLAAQLGSRAFSDDLRPLPAASVDYDPAEAGRIVSSRLLALL